jgi:hypothetical protein
MKHRLKLFIWFILHQPLKTSENRNSLTVSSNLVILEPVASLRLHYIPLFGVMLISPIPCLFVLLRVDEQVTEDPSTQQVDNSEQELVESKLCP